MSVMQVPRTIAPGLTLGAALSNRTHERPCASFPVTTRRIGFGVSVMLVSPLSLTLAEHCPTWGEARPPRNIHQKLREEKTHAAPRGPSETTAPDARELYNICRDNI